MKTVKLTALLAMTSIACGVAFAQPADTTGTQNQRQRPRPDGRMGNMGDSPVAKLRLANSLESLTAEQKTQIQEFIESRKEQFDSFRTEMRDTVQKARQGTDREARRQAMEPLRERHETMRNEVDTFLRGLLNPQQQQELKQKASELDPRGRMGRRGDDATTTGPREGRQGRRGAMRQHRPDPATGTPADTTATPSTTDAATTTTNPFATTE